jgi:hypothetical protein
VNLYIYKQYTGQRSRRTKSSKGCTGITDVSALLGVHTLRATGCDRARGFTCLRLSGVIVVDDEYDTIVLDGESSFFIRIGGRAF